MTAPSVAEVMRSVSSRAPSMRCVGASDEMIQLSTTEPMLEPMKPPDGGGAHAEDRAADRTANGGASGTENEGGHVGSQRCGNRKAKAMRRRHDGVSGSSITPSRS